MNVKQIKLQQKVCKGRCLLFSLAIFFFRLLAELSKEPHLQIACGRSHCRVGRQRTEGSIGLFSTTWLLGIVAVHMLLPHVVLCNLLPSCNARLNCYFLTNLFHLDGHPTFVPRMGSNSVSPLSSLTTDTVLLFNELALEYGWEDAKMSRSDWESESGSKD